MYRNIFRTFLTSAALSTEVLIHTKYFNAINLSCGYRQHVCLFLVGLDAVKMVQMLMIDELERIDYWTIRLVYGDAHFGGSTSRINLYIQIVT